MSQNEEEKISLSVSLPMKSRLDDLECIQCNKCTMSCPVHGVDPEFSPRGMILRLLQGEEASLLGDRNIYRCLACDLCREICPSHAKLVDHLRGYRHEARARGATNECKHGALLSSVQEMTATLNVPQNRLEWAAGLQIDPDSKIGYFVGCLPIFDQVFAHTESTAIARNTVQILNRLHIAPAVFQEEKCCGYDAYWGGENQLFEKLARHNISLLQQKKIERIVTSCPECYTALKFVYPNLEPSFRPEVVHLSQLLAQEIEEGRVKFRRVEKRITYHDPCRLGRVAKEYEAPRTILRAIPGLEFVEMPRNRDNAPCCGVGNYLNCDAQTKFLQHERLKEALSTGAHVMSTACPKCRIHFHCYLEGKPIESASALPVQDLTDVILESLET